jgi:hypothetical protein
VRCGSLDLRRVRLRSSLLPWGVPRDGASRVAASRRGDLPAFAARGAQARRAAAEVAGQDFGSESDASRIGRRGRGSQGRGVGGAA